MVDSQPNPESPPAAATDGGATIEPHTISIAAWDVPPAIGAGERFRMKVGLKCLEGCELADSEFSIYDHDGALVATGRVPAGIWPGTAGLHVAEVELAAPAVDGLYTWSVKGPSSEEPDEGIPHAGPSLGFGIRVVSRPEYVVRIEAVDAADQTPLTEARVFMHPYRAVTDGRGIAEVRVAKGTYKLFVSQTRYVTLGLPIEVDADMTARAELYVEPVVERN